MSIIIGLIAGIAMPLQTSVNAKLRQVLSSQYLVSAACFVGAIISSAIVIVATTGGLDIPLADVIKEPWWIWLGGVCGVGIVIFSMLSIPRLGSVETMVMLVLGQILVGLLIDQYGIFDSEVIRLTAMRGIGAALVLGGTIAISLSNGGEKAPSGDESQTASKGGSIWLYRLMAFSAGIFCGVQIAVNGALGAVVGNGIKATIISMSVAFTTVSILIIVLLAVKGKDAIIQIDPDSEPTRGKWWMWMGGPLSVVIVGGNAIIAKTLGTGLSAILNIVGQTLGGIAADAVGFLGIDKKPITLTKIIGTAVMFAGIVLVSL